MERTNGVEGTSKYAPYSGIGELVVRIALLAALSLAGFCIGFLSLFSAEAYGYLGFGFNVAGLLLSASAMALAMTAGRVHKVAVVATAIFLLCAGLLASNHLLLYAKDTVEQTSADTESYNETIDYDDYIPFDSDKIPRLDEASTLTFSDSETLPAMDSAAALLPLASGMYTACYPENVTIQGRASKTEQAEYDRLNEILNNTKLREQMLDSELGRYAELYSLINNGYADLWANRSADERGLIRQVSSQYGTYPVRVAPFQYNNTSLGYSNLANGVCDVMMGAMPSDDQIAYAREKGYELEYTPIGKEAFVFIVNKDNPVDSLTTDQVRAIYAGQITNWSEVGGNDEEIVAFQRNEGSGSQTQMERFMGDVPLTECATTFRSQSMGGLVRSIAGYDNRGNGIGYSFRYYAANLVEGADVKLLKIDGFYPDVSTISDGTYPLSSNFYAVTRSGELTSNENLGRLVTWMLSPQGQELVEKAGYAPLAS